MTDCKTHYITKVVNVMKQHQKKMLNDYLENGYVEQNTDSFSDGGYLYEEN
jgi:predicted transcriptional regulator